MSIDFVLLYLSTNWALSIFIILHAWREGENSQKDFVVISLAIFILTPVLIILLCNVLGYVERTKWYHNCKDRGYFIPTKSNKEAALLRTLTE